MTINKHTEHFKTEYFGVARNSRFITGVLMQRSVTFVDNEGREREFSSLDAPVRSALGLFPFSLDAPVPRTRVTERDQLLDGQFFLLTQACSHDGGSCSVTQDTSGFLSMKTVQVAPIPLPAALPLLATGFAVLGFAGFRRRRDGAPAAA